MDPALFVPVRSTRPRTTHDLTPALAVCHRCPVIRECLAHALLAKEHGAVLVKWIPSVMNIDPADPALEGFYRKLIEYRLPPLVHTGAERTFMSSHDELSDPVRLEYPLKLGVTVIAAH